MKLKFKKLVSLFVASFFVTSLNAATEIYPVTPGVIESVQEISELSKATENQMSSVTERLDNQLKTFRATGCEGAGKSEESNCMEQFKQIKANFIELLDGLDEQLPEIQDKTSNVTSQMKRNITKYGKKRTLLDLWEDVDGSSKINKVQKRSNRLGMSKMLSSMTKTLSRMKSNNRLVTGLLMYSDFEYVDMQISDLRGIITQHKANLMMPDEYLYNNAEQFGEVVGATMTVLYGGESDIDIDDGGLNEMEQEQNKAWYD